MTPHSLGTSQLEMSLAIGGKYNNLELLPNSGDDAGLQIENSPSRSHFPACLPNE